MYVHYWLVLGINAFDDIQDPRGRINKALYLLTPCLSSQGMPGVDGVQGSKGNIVSTVEVGVRGPCN